MWRRDRCSTVCPLWQSPSTPRLAIRGMEACGVLEMRWVVERETERTDMVVWNTWVG